MFVSTSAHDERVGGTLTYVRHMPRPPRIQAPGATYHVTARGNRRGAIFADDFDRYRFLGQLAKVVHQRAWACHAYCLLTTHYHLLLTTPEADIAAGMQALNGTYADGFNRRHKLCGHVFQGRYGAVIVEQESHLLELFRYIALNPVRAGLCRAPEAWPWSSYRDVIVGDGAADFLSPDSLLNLFGPDPGRARPRLREFVTQR